MVCDQQWLNRNFFVAALVYEFYVNLSPSIMVDGSAQFHKVYVRGHVFNFSAKLINDLFGFGSEEDEVDELSDDEVNKDDIATELYGVDSVWPIEKRLKVSKLTTTYAMLTRVGKYKWFPTTHGSTIYLGIGNFLYKLGKYIFDQIVSHANINASRSHMVFPSLITMLLLVQAPICQPHEPRTSLKRIRIVTNRFLKGNRVFDIQGKPSASQNPASTSATASSVTSQEIIAELRQLRTSHDHLTANVEKILLQQAEFVKQQGVLYDALTGFIRLAARK